jgi:hypothetical protein
MDDRAFWGIVRKALLEIASAIEKRWHLGRYEVK